MELWGRWFFISVVFIIPFGLALYIMVVGSVTQRLESLLYGKSVLGIKEDLENSFLGLYEEVEEYAAKVSRASAYLYKGVDLTQEMDIGYANIIKCNQTSSVELLYTKPYTTIRYKNVKSAQEDMFLSGIIEADLFAKIKPPHTLDPKILISYWIEFILQNGYIIYFPEDKDMVERTEPELLEGALNHFKALHDQLKELEHRVDLDKLSKAKKLTEEADTILWLNSPVEESYEIDH